MKRTSIFRSAWYILKTSYWILDSLFFRDEHLKLGPEISTAKLPGQRTDFWWEEKAMEHFCTKGKFKKPASNTQLR